VVHKYDAFKKPVPRNEGRIVLLLVQRDDLRVWPEFVTEAQLGSGAWHDSVAKPILKCLRASRGRGQVARGFIDYSSGMEYCDA
jgi:hypothetical protein